MDDLLYATEAAEARHFWFRGFRRFVSPFIEAAVAGVGGPRILDCGCGTGANLALLARAGRPVGIDLNGVGLAFARRKGIAPVARATVTCLPFPDATFDLACSFDVIYCLEDDDERAAVGEMWRVLKPGGAAVINVAAMEVLRGNHSVLSEEVRRYSAARLRAVVEGTGFRVTSLRYTNSTLFPLMLGVRTVQRLVGLRPAAHAGAEIRVPPAPVNALLSALLAVEARLLGPLRLPFGSSLLCLARKAAAPPPE